MVAMTHASPFTYADLQGMPDDGRRYELLDGALLVTPSPGTSFIARKPNPSVW